MKKITLGIFVFSVIALLGVGIVAALPFGFGKGAMSQELTEEEQIEMQSFHDSLQDAIDNEDFDAWKSLMESQLTEENFNKMIEMQNYEEEQRSEMKQAREQFCEENNCPDLEDFEEGEFPGNFENPRRMHRNFPESNSE